MSFDNERLLDEVGWQLLRALQEEARLSYAELGRKVGLSPPAVTERVRKMEEEGIIKGYWAEVSAEKIGLPLVAFIRLKTPPDRYKRFLTLVSGLPEVRECHHVAGDDSFIMKVFVASMSHLETLLGQLSPYGQTTTSIVLSSPIVKHSLEAGSNVLNEEE